MAANIHSATVRCRLARTTSSSFCHSPVPDLCNDWNFVRACCLRYERLETNLDGSSAERERWTGKTFTPRPYLTAGRQWGGGGSICGIKQHVPITVDLDATLAVGDEDSAR